MTRLPIFPIVISILMVGAVLAAFAPFGRGVAWAQSELAIGASALVNDTDGGGLRLRSGPGLSQSVQATLADRLNPYELLSCEAVVLTAAGLARMKEVFAR